MDPRPAADLIALLTESAPPAGRRFSRSCVLSPPTRIEVTDGVSSRPPLECVGESHESRVVQAVPSVRVVGAGLEARPAGRAGGEDRSNNAVYGEFEVTIEIETGIMAGRFPKRALALVLEWAGLHREELMENWNLALDGRPLNPVAPLE